MSILSKKDIIFNKTDQKAVNNMKAIGLDIAYDQNKNYSQTGISSANILYTLFKKHLRFDKNEPDWINRDRLILASKEAFPILYSFLYLLDIEKEKEKFIKDEDEKIKGLDFKSNCNHGFSTAVGVAISEKYLNNRYQSKKESIIDYNTYVLCDEESIINGTFYEAASLASNLNLNKLITIYNNTSQKYNKTLKEDITKVLKELNFDVYSVNNDLESINETIEKAKANKEKPSFIEIKQGNKSEFENSDVLTKEIITKLKEELEIRDVPYTILEEVDSHIKEEAYERSEDSKKTYNRLYAESLFKTELEQIKTNNLLLTLNNMNEEEKTEEDASRSFINNIISNNLIIEGIKNNKLIKEEELFLPNNLKGQKLFLGNRITSYGYILNGITLGGIRTCSLLTLNDFEYIKLSVKDASILNLPIIYIIDKMDKDSLFYFDTLKKYYNCIIYKPYDINELIGSYKSLIKNIEGPSLVVLNSDKDYIDEQTDIKKVAKGGYIVKDFDKIDGIIEASGEDLDLALEISEKLEMRNINIRVVSMLSNYLFEKQTQKYKKEVYPEGIKRIILKNGNFKLPKEKQIEELLEIEINQLINQFEDLLNN